MIEIYKDEELLHLTQKMTNLRSEFDTKIARFEDSEDVVTEMISVYEATNNYLQIHYPKNVVADRLIGKNISSAELLKEYLPNSESST